jgi:hypothetical protein
MISTTPTNSPTNCRLCVGTEPADGGTRFFRASETGDRQPCSGITRISRGTNGLQTHRWRETDSNLRSAMGTAFF